MQRKNRKSEGTGKRGEVVQKRKRAREMFLYEILKLQKGSLAFFDKRQHFRFSITFYFETLSDVVPNDYNIFSKDLIRMRRYED